MIDAMRSWLDSIEGDIVVSVEAGKFVAQQRETNPVEFHAWLDENAERFVTEIMGRISVSDRAKAQRRSSSTGFADAAKRFAEGDETALDPVLDVRYVIDDDNTRRRLKEMTWSDLDFAASSYEYLAASNGNEAKVLRAIQKKLPKNGSRCVGDVFSDAQLRSLRIAA